MRKLGAFSRHSKDNHNFQNKPQEHRGKVYICGIQEAPMFMVSVLVPHTVSAVHQILYTVPF